MNWLIISDDKNVSAQLKTVITAQDKANVCTTCDFDTTALRKNKETFKRLVACFIFSSAQNLGEDALSTLSGVAGYMASKRIFVITNVGVIAKNILFEENMVHEVKDASGAEVFITKNYTQITQQAVKRLAKKKLLERGIPFTSDCFATYIAKNKMEIFNEFLEAGMEINSRDDLGTPMLNIACRNDNFEFVEMLLKLGADLNAVSEDRGYTAVMDAVWRGNEKITRYLIEKGAELNTINKEGQNNLILAVGANRANICKLLAENGADPDVKDQMGMSAYGYATLFKKTAIVEILRPFHKEA